jgi:hypothetical protein
VVADASDKASVTNLSEPLTNMSFNARNQLPMLGAETKKDEDEIIDRRTKLGLEGDLYS